MSFLVLLCLSVMSVVKGEDVIDAGETVAEEGYLSNLDGLLLGALVLAVMWYYFKGRGDNDDAMPPANIHIRYIYIYIYIQII